MLCVRVRVCVSVSVCVCVCVCEMTSWKPRSWPSIGSLSTAMSVVGGAKSAWSNLSGRGSGGHNLQSHTLLTTIHTQKHTVAGSLPCSPDVVDGNVLWREKELFQASRQRRVRGKLLH